jgi:hypothetical protein
MDERQIMRTRIHSLRILFCSFVALISAAIAAHGEMSQGTAVVKSVVGSATYLDELGFSHPLAVGTVLKAGHTVKTSVDSAVGLFLDQNGPEVGLDANSTLRLEKLAYENTSLGTKIETLLDLKQGVMFGSVKKLIASSRYEVKTPKGIAHVRGTEFYIDEKEGTVSVVSGTVTLTVTVNAPNNAPGQTVFTTTVTINAGETVKVPNDFTDNADFLAKTAPQPTQGGFEHMTHYVRTGPASVSETFDGKKAGSKINVKKPPVTVVVSP